MSNKRWSIGIFDLNEVNELQKGLYGQHYNHSIISGFALNTAIPVAKALLSMRPNQHKKLMAECKKLIEPNVEIKHVPNLESIKTKRENRMVTEPCGIFGLFTRTVRKQVEEPNPEFSKIDRQLRGESYILIISERESEQRSDIEIEGDDVILLTDSGRFVNLCYEIRYCTSFLYPYIYSARELDQMDERVNILMAGMICRYIGFEEFNKIVKKYN